MPNFCPSCFKTNNQIIVLATIARTKYQLVTTYHSKQPQKQSKMVDKKPYYRKNMRHESQHSNRKVKNQSENLKDELCLVIVL